MAREGRRRQFQAGCPSVLHLAGSSGEAPWAAGQVSNDPVSSKAPTEIWDHFFWSSQPCQPGELPFSWIPRTELCLRDKGLLMWAYLHPNRLMFNLKQHHGNWRMENKLGFKEHKYGNFPGSPVVVISPSNPEGLGLIPGQGTKIPPALGPRNQNVKQKQKGNKFNEDFKNGTHFKKNLRRKEIWDMRQKLMSHENTVWRGSGGLLLNQEIVPCSGLAHPFTPPRRADMLSTCGFDVFWAGWLRVPHGRGTTHWENGKRQRNGSKGQWDHPERVSGGVVSRIWVSLQKSHPTGTLGV